MKISQSRLYRLFSLFGIPVYGSRGLLVLLALGFMASFFYGQPVVVAVVALFFLVLLHELGHAFLARRRHFRVIRIELHAGHGGCLYEADEIFEYDDAVICWGGVLAQMLVAIPAFAYLIFVGNTDNGVVNALLIVFSGINLVLMVMTMMPIDGWDGSKAWRIFPILWMMRKRRLALNPKKSRKRHLKVLK